MVVSLYANTPGTGGGSTTVPDALPTHGQVASVPTNAETTVVTRVTAPGFAYRLAGLIVSGSADAEWIVYDNATEVFRTRTSSAGERGKHIPLPNPIPFASTHACTVKAVHQEPGNQNFYATLLGYEG